MATAPRCRRVMCPTCIFRHPDPMQLRPERHGEIRAYLIQGANHMCHEPGPGGRPDELVCRGARAYQLDLWARLGILEAPTDAALAAAMRAAGVDPDPDYVAG